MPGRARRAVGAIGESKSNYVVLPRDWCRGIGLEKGARVELLFNHVLVVVPPRERRTAESVLRLMREGRL